MKTEITLSSLPRKKALDREDQGTFLFTNRLKIFRELQSMAVDNTKNTRKKYGKKEKTIFFCNLCSQKFCEETGGLQLEYGCTSLEDEPFSSKSGDTG
jgi:hypothetical protein